MFVRESTYKRVVQERNQEAHDALMLRIKLSSIQTKWNDLVRRINAKGGEEFLKFGTIGKDTARTVHQFTDDELRSLLQLVHPDKHNGKQSAVVMTQKINALRK